MIGSYGYIDPVRIPVTIVTRTRANVNIPVTVRDKNHIEVGEWVAGILEIEDPIGHSRIIGIDIRHRRMHIGLCIEITGLAEPAGAATIEKYQQLTALGRWLYIELVRRTGRADTVGSHGIPAGIQGT